MFVNEETTYEATVPALTSQDYRSVEGGVVIDASKVPELDNAKKIRPYEVLAKITATGLYRPVGYTQIATAGSSITTVEVDSARPFVSGDTVTIGSTTGLSVTGVDYVNDEITVGTAISPSVDDKVALESGAETAELVTLSGVDVSKGDQVIGAVDLARFNKARMPITIYSQIETDLAPLIKFE